MQPIIKATAGGKGRPITITECPLMRRLGLALALAFSLPAHAAIYSDLDATNTVTNNIVWDGVTPYTPAPGHTLNIPAGCIGSTWNGSTYSACPAPAVGPDGSAILTLSSIPTSGPGAGLCKEIWVPSALVSPPGTAGTCSKLQMCGTSSTYTILSTNVGSGC